VRVTSAGSGRARATQHHQTTGGVALVHSESESTPCSSTATTTSPPARRFRVEWGDDVLRSIGAWRSATHREMNGSTATGTSADPKLTAAGKAPTLNDASKLSR
jgi:hypothetical protein